MPEVGTFDFYPEQDVFTITSTHVTNNSNLGITAGSYILSGNASNGWKVQPVDISVPNSVVTSGNPISITPNQKTVWDSLSLSATANFGYFDVWPNACSCSQESVLYTIPS